MSNLTKIVSELELFKMIGKKDYDSPSDMSTPSDEMSDEHDFDDDRSNPFETEDDYEDDFEHEFNVDRNENEFEEEETEESDFGERFIDFLNNEMGKKYKLVKVSDEDDMTASEYDREMESDDIDFDDMNSDESMNDEFDERDDFNDEEMSDDMSMDDEFGDAAEESEFDGVVRTVAGANLVYKRSMPDGDFEELWIYNIGKDIKHDTKVKQAILAGTDIDPNTSISDDGTQRVEVSSVGNVQYLKITGLPN